MDKRGKRRGENAEGKAKGKTQREKIMRGGYDNIELARTHAGPPPPPCGGSRHFSMWLQVNCFVL